MVVRRRVLILVAVVLGLLLLSGWLAARVVQAATAVQDLQAALDGSRPEAESLDIAALRARLPAVQDAAHRGSAAVADPVWRAAQHLPFVGDDLAAVSAVVTAVDELARDAVPGLLDALAVLGDAGGTGDAGGADDAGGVGAQGAAAGAGAATAPAPRVVPPGWVDLAPLADAAPAAARAARIADDLRADLTGIDPTRLIGRVAGPVAQLQAALHDAAAALAGVQEVATVLPAMLGADGPRTYLLLSLNPAELRVQGGIVGAVVALQARDGAVGLVGQRSTADLPGRPEAVLPLTQDERVLYGDRIGRWVQDTVLTPDFPRAATLAAEFWTQSTGQPVDGVLATDPVVVADLLAATGRTVQTAGADLSGDTLLHALLREAYLTYGDPRGGDLFYAEVASAVFALLQDVAVDPVVAHAAVSVGGEALADRRVALWSAHPEEQARIGTMSLGGAFLTGDAPTPTGGAGAAVGVFLDDGTAGKLDYDLDATVTVEMLGCGTDRPAARVEVALDYQPPGDVATFPAQVVGSGGSGLPVGWLATNVSFYSARDGRLGEVRRNDAVIGGQRVHAARRDVAVLTSRLEPGAREVYTVTVGAPGGGLTVWTTPTLTGPGIVTGECPSG